MDIPVSQELDFLIIKQEVDDAFLEKLMAENDGFEDIGEPFLEPGQDLHDVHISEEEQDRQINAFYKLFHQPGLKVEKDEPPVHPPWVSCPKPPACASLPDPLPLPLPIPVPNRQALQFELNINASGKWECQICHKEFRHQYTLVRHMPTHTDVRNHICRTCGKAFRQVSTLRQHRAIHSNVRPHVCSECGKSFNRISTLISHRKTHTDNKPHGCKFCGKRFHQKGNLRNHVFTHTGERPYKCEICGKGFNQDSNLRCHKKHAHDFESHHQCRHCWKLFSSREFLIRHEQNVHNITRPYRNRDTRGETTSKKDMVIDWFETPELIEAWDKGEVPYAELKPLSGPSGLVRLVPVQDGKLALKPVSSHEFSERYVTLVNNKFILQIPLVAKIVETSEPTGRTRLTVERITPEVNLRNPFNAA